MELTYRSRDGRMIVKITAETQKELFEKVYEVQSVFEADARCGDCDSDALQLQVRTIDKNKYYSMKCMACECELHFGQHKVGGTLFAKRDPRQTRGWKRYNPNEEH